MNLQRYFDVSTSTDIRALEGRLIDFANHMDFPLVTAAVVTEGLAPGSEPQFTVIGNTPEAFKATQLDVEISKRDPVTRRLKKLSVPFLYDQAMYVSEGLGEAWEHQARFGYKTGIAVALHLPGHKHFLLGVDRFAPLPTQEEKVIRMMADLQLLAVHAQSAAVRLFSPDPDEPQLPRFTPREMEILRWCMDGKSAWQTGALLNISEATVNFHLRNVCTKLNVSSKHQAVLKAVNLGLLS
jgi:DNA-binding CsgD family transcriptional regulator